MVARLAARVACIYPFAYEVYKEAGAPVEFVGNPLVDIVKPTMSQLEAQKAVGKGQAIRSSCCSQEAVRVNFEASFP